MESFGNLNRYFPYFGNDKNDFLNVFEGMVKIDSIADACFRRHGVFPISFSFPNSTLVNDRIIPRDFLFSEFRPGTPYTFTDLEKYLHHYARSSMALTHKKWGGTVSDILKLCL
jgi:hypothetical protein